MTGEGGGHGRAPFFSVVIATYNRAHLIPETLESVFRQTDPDYEVIVVDDGSTDDTRRVLEPYRERIRYVYQENRGVSAAWNRGIAEARGEVVTFLASDDLWEPATLAKVREALAAHPEAGLVSVMGREITPDGKRTEKVYGKKSPGPWYTTASLLREDSGGCSWVFVRREALERVGGYDESLRSAEDCDFCIRLSFHTRMFALREPLLLRRVHTGNLSGDQLLNARAWLRILEKLAREHPEFVRAHPRVYRRALGKESLRLGRELLAQVEAQPDALPEARRALARSIRAWPWFLRAYLYLAFAWTAPRAFARWRRRELALRTLPGHPSRYRRRPEGGAGGDPGEGH